MLISNSLAGIRAQEELRFDRNPQKQARLIGILFCRPELKLMQSDIAPSLPYFHQRSGKNTAFYFAGFETSDIAAAQQHVVVKGPNDEPWCFVPASFNYFRREVERLTKWRYSGGCDMILANSRRGMPHTLRSAPDIDFTSAIVLRLDKIHELVATPTVSELFEAIFQYAERQMDANPTWGLSDHLGIKTVRSGLWEVLIGMLPQNLRGSVRAAHHLVAQDIGIQASQAHLFPESP